MRKINPDLWGGKLVRFGKKDILAQFIGFWPVTKVLTVLCDLKSTSIPILAYHRVYNIKNHKHFHYDEGLVSASCEQFEWQVKYLKKYYNPITFHELNNSLKNNKKLPSNPVIITFDDGYIDNYSNAFRILKENNVVAVFYVSTQYIGTNKIFWFDDIVHHLKSTKKEKIFLNVIDEALDLSTDQGVKDSINTVLSRSKIISNEERLCLVEEVVLECDIGVADHEADHFPMSWDDVREISSYGCEIGSHSISHPILSQVSSKQLVNEINDSKKIIEKEIGKEVLSIAYPVGGLSACNDEVIRLVRDSGYKFGCTYIPGDNDLNGLNKYKLKRAHIETYTTNNYFKSIMLIPSVFG